MQAAHSSTLRRVRSLSARPLTMSASANLPPGAQDPRRLGVDAALDRREVDDAVGEDRVEARVLEGEMLDVSLDEFDLREPVSVPEPRGLVELCIGDVDPDDAARLAHQHH